MTGILKVDQWKDSGDNTLMTSDGAGNLTANVSFTSPGITLSDNILFNTASKGVYLGVTSATASNLLDDYEEGTWTPVFLGGGSNPTVSYNTQEGRYTKIGNLVYVQAYALVNTTSGGSGNLRLGGLPFTAVNASSRGFASIALTNIESTIVVTQLIDPNSTYSILRKGNQPPAEIQVSDLANGEYLWYSGVYQVS